MELLPSQIQAITQIVDQCRGSIINWNTSTVHDPMSLIAFIANSRVNANQLHVTRIALYESKLKLDLRVKEAESRYERMISERVRDIDPKAFRSADERRAQAGLQIESCSEAIELAALRHKVQVTEMLHNTVESTYKHLENTRADAQTIVDLLKLKPK